MPNKQFFLSFENFEKGLIVLYACDLPVIPKTMARPALVARLPVIVLKLQGFKIGYNVSVTTM